MVRLRIASLLLAVLLVAFAPMLRGTAVGALGDGPLRDSLGGAPLFGDAVLLEGEPLARCVTVTNVGGAGTLDVSLLATVDGDLAEVLATAVATGTGTSRDCTDFVAGATLFRGTLAGLGGHPLASGSLADGASVTYRIEVLATASPVGRATLDLTWAGTR